MIKKFFIQWTKFESKKSSKNEVMNFLRLIFFFRIFYDFLRICRVKIFAKKGVYIRRTRRELTWHDMNSWQHHVN